MRLKAFTTLMLVVGFASLVAWPMLLAARPGREELVQAKQVWAVRMIALGATSVVALVGAGVGSMLIIRAARDEYALQSSQNLKGLVDGLRESSRRPSAAEPDELSAPED